MQKFGNLKLASAIGAVVFTAVFANSAFAGKAEDLQAAQAALAQSESDLAYYQAALAEANYQSQNGGQQFGERLQACQWRQTQSEREDCEEDVYIDYDDWRIGVDNDLIELPQDISIADMYVYLDQQVVWQIEAMPDY